MNYEQAEQTTSAACFPGEFSAILAEGPKVLPPVSMVESLHVAVHVLFRPWV